MEERRKIYCHFFVHLFAFLVGLSKDEGEKEEGRCQFLPITVWGEGKGGRK